MLNLYTKQKREDGLYELGFEFTLFSSGEMVKDYNTNEFLTPLEVYYRLSRADLLLVNYEFSLNEFANSHKEDPEDVQDLIRACRELLEEMVVKKEKLGNICNKYIHFESLAKIAELCDVFKEKHQILYKYCEVQLEEQKEYFNIRVGNDFSAR